MKKLSNKSNSTRRRRYIHESTWVHASLCSLTALKLKKAKGGDGEDGAMVMDHPVVSKTPNRRW
jgi:hypothetical protein